MLKFRAPLIICAILTQVGCTAVVHAGETPEQKEVLEPMAISIMKSEGCAPYHRPMMMGQVIRLPMGEDMAMMPEAVRKMLHFEAAEDSDEAKQHMGRELRKGRMMPMLGGKQSFLESGQFYICQIAIKNDLSPAEIVELYTGLVNAANGLETAQISVAPHAGP